MIRVRIGLAVAAAGVLAVTACTPPGPQRPTPAPTSAEPTSTIDPADRYAPPTEPPAGDEFGLEDAARYEDGVQLQLASITAGTASESMTGAEGTDGEIVTAVIEVVNDGNRSVNLSNWVVQGYYGEADVGAQLVGDSEGAVGDSFEGAVGPGQTVTGAFAFAVPASELGNVTVAVDRRDDVNDPVQFTGAVG
ncbi:DUF4352 domain-containing protein [Naumannella cuiyingiana]|uniref:DUF4352 domain-containing protein n=1 Tax=Naumannella cuiyingiana TaxID=1347891 RepID=A0A7Z0IL09_9ACTN|nr:hypothetical protein [Naumannella cuiyingiana]NYI71032.1 hypothetical protein [Naumannella cuiyingiana]